MQAVVYMLIRLIPLLMLFAVNCLPSSAPGKASGKVLFSFSYDIIFNGKILCYWGATGTANTFCAVALDAEGNYGPVFRSVPTSFDHRKCEHYPLDTFC